MKFNKLLRPNDLVLVISPSYSPESAELDAGIQILSRNGFRVEKGPNTGKTWGNFAGSDAERLSDLQWALDHPEASMIICSRGGYGMGRIVRQLDFSGFAKKPKWLIGFSDITLLHTRLQENGFASMHGPMLVHHTQMNQLTACLRQQDFLDHLIGSQRNSLRSIVRFRLDRLLPPLNELT
jgi:muramoyltetrapeptide carboxypeptidase